MAKATSWIEASDIRVTFRFNQREPLSDGQGEGYRPITMFIDIQAKTDDGGIKDRQFVVPIGSVAATPETNQQLATRIKGTNNSTGNFIVTELSKALNDAIGVTVS